MSESDRMREELELDADLMEKAKESTGIKDSTQLLHRALELLIHHEASQRLAALGGTQPNFSVAARRTVSL